MFVNVARRASASLTTGMPLTTPCGCPEFKPSGKSLQLAVFSNWPLALPNTAMWRGVFYSCLGHRKGAYNPCPKWARIYRLMTESGSKAFPASRAPEV